MFINIPKWTRLPYYFKLSQHSPAKSYLNKRYIIIILSVLLIFFFATCYYDWDDPETWAFNRRYLRTDMLLKDDSSRKKVEGLECSRYLLGNETDLHEYRNLGRFVLDIKDSEIKNSCSDINRILGNKRRNSRLTNPYAVSRVVYENYYWLLDQLEQNYSPQNIYCFSVDSKSSADFYGAVKQLEKCIPNVFVSSIRYSYDSNGHYINFGHWDCTRTMLRFSSNWKYVLWLQNYDVFLKTNEEISQIIRFLNGSQSVGYKQAHLKRYNFLKGWTARSLKLWKNESSISQRQANAVLKISQMYNEVFLSRQLIEYVNSNMNLMNLMEAFEQPLRFATDELLWATLLASPDLELPGQVEGGCRRQDTYITRYNEWEDYVKCKSAYSRHGTCLFGMEYLKLFSDLHQIVANKIMPRFDYGIVLCMGELIHNRTYGIADSSPSMNIYSGISQGYC
ncbi:unnamed protein product [Auanema sp. JU1783]|nr:unnamed protein product [Auanema sp. JU1783]